MPKKVADDDTGCQTSRSRLWAELSRVEQGKNKVRAGQELGSSWEGAGAWKAVQEYSRGRAEAGAVKEQSWSKIVAS